MTEELYVGVVGRKKGRLYIRFKYDRYIVASMKTLDDWEYHSEDKMWTADDNPSNIKKLERLNFKIQTFTKEFLPKISFIPPFKNKMFPFQKKGVRWIYYFDKNALLADEMGLGKTIQSLAFVSQEPKHRPVLIVCTVSAKLNWAREINIWFPFESNITIINGRDPLNFCDKHFTINSFVIINYDIIKDHEDWLKKVPFNTVIIDEVHKIKNPKAQKTKATLAVAKRIPYRLGLTGTPMENRPIELHNVLRLLKPSLISDRWRFAKKYCNLRRTPFGWDMTGASNKKELHKLLVHNVMIRRKKSNVYKQLPDKQRAPVPFTLSNYDQYLQMEYELLEGDEKNALKAYHELSMMCWEGKKEMIYDWLDTFFETENKFVLFLHHKSVMSDLYGKYKDIAVKIDGSVKQTERQEVVDKFQNEKEVKLFLGNIQAAGEVITLTAAHHVRFAQYVLVPTALSQAEDRVHRISQKDKVTVYYFYAENSYEYDLLTLLAKKEKIINEIIEGKGVEDFNLITELIKMSKERRGII